MFADITNLKEPNEATRWTVLENMKLGPFSSFLAGFTRPGCPPKTPWNVRKCPLLSVISINLAWPVFCTTTLIQTHAALECPEMSAFVRNFKKSSVACVLHHNPDPNARCPWNVRKCPLLSVISKNLAWPVFCTTTPIQTPAALECPEMSAFVRNFKKSSVACVLHHNPDPNARRPWNVRKCPHLSVISKNPASA